MKKLQSRGSQHSGVTHSFILVNSGENLYLCISGISLGRFTGTIVGIEDSDPKSWSESKWRCLKVLL